MEEQVDAESTNMNETTNSITNRSEMDTESTNMNEKTHFITIQPESEKNHSIQIVERKLLIGRVLPRQESSTQKDPIPGQVRISPEFHPISPEFHPISPRIHSNFRIKNVTSIPCEKRYKIPTWVVTLLIGLVVGPIAIVGCIAIVGSITVFCLRSPVLNNEPFVESDALRIAAYIKSNIEPSADPCRSPHEFICGKQFVSEKQNEVFEEIATYFKGKKTINEPKTVDEARKMFSSCINKGGLSIAKLKYLNKAKRRFLT